MQWSGDDATAPAYRAMGGIGWVSVTANIAPALCAVLHRAWDEGDLGRFAAARDLLDPLHAALFAESNPVPVKAALASLGLCTCDVRLPLTRATPATQERLIRVMAPAMQAEEHCARFFGDGGKMPAGSAMLPDAAALPLTDRPRDRHDQAYEARRR